MLQGSGAGRVIAPLGVEPTSTGSAWWVRDLRLRGEPNSAPFHIDSIWELWLDVNLQAPSHSTWGDSRADPDEPMMASCLPR